MLLCLAVLSSACASKPRTIVNHEPVLVEKRVFVTIPTPLTERIEVPAIEPGMTYGGLMLWASSAIEAIKTGNGRLTAIGGLSGTETNDGD